MNYKIVFSDIDGTLLNSNHRMSENTENAIKNLKRQGIPFVIVTARGPSGVYPIFRRYNFVAPIICYSGALILGEDGEIIFSKGISKSTVSSLIRVITEEGWDCTWNVYTMDDWIVNDKSDERVIKEENIVEVQSTKGSVDDIPNGMEIGKFLCMCNPDEIDEIEAVLKKKYPSLSIVKSSDILLEVMEKGVNKGIAVEMFCEKLNINKIDAVAFGDHYNDIEMLKTVGAPFLMENAPEDMKADFNITSSNDEEGVFQALKKIGLLD
ncbi:Cof-type HAD-IIB family hydrolase [Pseudobutyrivibrio xylanivorans]|uniref:Cof subfamily of IIB subfamily of haloacid dehalogenase superfamily/HAD-superfamily hydrolase, subfamily IIB n=1 Tax=Pseudobutyrivibrio xylanivorans DSM 14809 TaxID=1123012 RepID=A0A1M6A017_PSEXY|nr:Cof-type HAD-IIB family hydrolase [Pseudobutyrivibrio xylanivorans]SHI29800.1 hypothetical protein SAMN02745725_00030 [Pseudobutyrivibrio xylanivorans DSM 14809]